MGRREKGNGEEQKERRLPRCTFRRLSVTESGTKCQMMFDMFPTLFCCASIFGMLPCACLSHLFGLFFSFLKFRLPLALFIVQRVTMYCVSLVVALCLKMVFFISLLIYF